MNQPSVVGRLGGWGLTESPSKKGGELQREGPQCGGKDSGWTSARAVRALAVFPRLPLSELILLAVS